MDGTDRKVIVWDAATRLFHWLTVALVAAAYVTVRMNRMEWHALAGEALLALLLFRVLLGFFGGETTRFACFLAPPREALHHLAHLLRREPDRRAGHNPAGGWMVLLLLALLLAETLSGLYVAHDVADEGPLSEMVPAAVANAITALHSIGWDLILVAVTLHVMAIVVYAVAKRHDLVRPMITGWKSLPDSVPQPRLIGTVRTALLFGCGVLAAAALVAFL